MIGAAYRYADDGGTPPREIVLASLIEDYGVAAVMNRNYLGAGEINRMRTAKAVIRIYQERQKAQNWAAWARENPEDCGFLNSAMKAAENDK